jgi:hypothetical protein
LLHPEKEKAPSDGGASVRNSSCSSEGSVNAQIDRPAVAGMLEPVVMRETEHLH